MSKPSTPTPPLHNDPACPSICCRECRIWAAATQHPDCFDPKTGKRKYRTRP